MCGTQEPMGSGVPGGTHPNFENMGSSGFRVPGKLGQSGFRWVPGSRQIGPKWVPMGSGFQVGTQKVGSGGFRVPGRNPKSGFRWVPGSRSEPKKWVPGGSRFQVGTQKVGSGFQVGTPKSGFRANWAKLGSVTVLKKEIFKVDDLDNILTKIRNI